MKVLADRHHAGLFYSLQLLGDRLGWDLYTPVGREWWDQGYWRFGEVYGDERLVDQYLSTDDAAWSRWQSPSLFRNVVTGDMLPTDRYVTRDRDYPDREIWGATLGYARTQSIEDRKRGEPHRGWDLVIATVQENQRGFARFAAEVGARYVYQVGNTRQDVDWSLEPLVLASSEVPLRSGIRYRQEMHPAFGWREPLPGSHLRVTSLVQYMPRTNCWPLLYATARALPGHDFRVHGAGCPDGLVNPTTAVAEVMAESGWGWHDKETGDGFGHVLWGWAAIGRPLIGHASHYRGQLGEVLWTPETSIDLDTQDVIEVLRDMTPDRHAGMCDAMRRTFAAHYNPERDAQAIREFLA